MLLLRDFKGVSLPLSRDTSSSLVSYLEHVLLHGPFSQFYLLIYFIKYFDGGCAGEVREGLGLGEVGRAGRGS